MATPPESPSTSTPGPTPPHFPILLPPIVLLSDLGRQFIWPPLLRTPAAALWPSRLALGILAALLVGLLGSLSTFWSDSPPFLAALLSSQAEAWASVRDALIQLDPPRLITALRTALVDSPTTLLLAYPVSAPILIPLMLAPVVAAGGAIARSIAVESATSRRPTAPAMLGWSLARWPSTYAAVLTPLLAIALLILAIRALGWLGYSLPGVNIAAAMLYPIILLLALLLLGIIIALGLAGPMIVPARIIEDSDAVDALQRPVAYLIAKPVRTLIYLAIALGISGLALALARAITGGTWSLALEHTTAWLGPARDAALTGVMPPAADGAAQPLPTTTRIAHWLIHLWGNIPALLVAGYAISLFFTAGAKAYLAARQICDGQDQADIQGEALPSDSAPAPAPAAPAPPDPAGP